ncbi:unnamed protein product [[Candida] boidinii]|nr:unnamed protein product [[Candida] boidinii]
MLTLTDVKEKPRWLGGWVDGSVSASSTLNLNLTPPSCVLATPSIAIPSQPIPIPIPISNHSLPTVAGVPRGSGDSAIWPAYLAGGLCALWFGLLLLPQGYGNVTCHWRNRVEGYSHTPTTY